MVVWWCVRLPHVGGVVSGRGRRCKERYLKSNVLRGNLAFQRTFFAPAAAPTYASFFYLTYLPVFCFCATKKRKNQTVALTISTMAATAKQ